MAASASSPSNRPITLVNSSNIFWCRRSSATADRQFGRQRHLLDLLQHTVGDETGQAGLVDGASVCSTGRMTKRDSSAARQSLEGLRISIRPIGWRLLFGAEAGQLPNDDRIEEER